MHKVRRCEEVVGGNGKQYRFAGTFGNIEAASFLCGDPAEVFLELAEGATPPTTIRSIILCCIEDVDGEPVTDNTRDDFATEFVEDFGLQDCSLLARHLLTHAIVGNVKKKQIDRGEKLEGLRRKLRLSILTASGRRGWSLAALLLILAGLACTIFRYW